MEKNVCDCCECESLLAKREIKGNVISTCLGCGFMFVSKKLSDSDYSQSYREVPNASKFLKQRHYDLLNFIKGHKNASVLEVGSGFGGLALLCRLEGIKYTGIEPDLNRREFMQSLSIDRIFKMHTELNETFDLILLDNVLEHIEDPQNMVSDLCHLLSKRGKFIIVVPNRYDFRRISTKWSSKHFWIPNDHLSYFRTCDVEALFSSSGFELTSRLNYGTKLLKIIKTFCYKIKIEPFGLSLIFEKRN